MARKSGDDVRILAVDPGGVHVGLAWFEDFPQLPAGWQCTRAEEITNEELYRELAEGTMLADAELDAVIVERFNLYPDIAPSLTGQEMTTSELIGALQLACMQLKIPLIRQPAAWQQPTQGVLKSLKMKSTAKQNKAGPHAFSAELHGWAYLFRSGVTTKPSPQLQQLANLD